MCHRVFRSFRKNAGFSRHPLALTVVHGGGGGRGLMGWAPMGQEVELWSPLEPAPSTKFNGVELHRAAGR